MSDIDALLQSYREKKLSPDGFFSEFETLYRKPLLGFFLTFAPPAQIEDLYQELLLKLQTALSDYAPGTHFKAWLFRMARNLALDNRRGEKVRSDSREEMPPEIRARGPGPKTENIQKEIRGLVNQALDGLKAEYRELLFMKYYANLTFREISLITGLPVSTIQVRLEKGINLLNEIVKSLETK